MWKVVPRPFSLCTMTYPPLCFTMPYTVESPRPVPFAFFLGGKERFKDARLRFLVHARAGVAHREHHVVAGTDEGLPATMVFIDHDILSLNR